MNFKKNIEGYTGCLSKWIFKAMNFFQSTIKATICEFEIFSAGLLQLPNMDFSNIFPNPIQNADLTIFKKIFKDILFKIIFRDLQGWLCEF